MAAARVATNRPIAVRLTFLVAELATMPAVRPTRSATPAGPPAEVASATAAIVAPEPTAPLNPPSTSSVYSPPVRALWKALAAATTTTTINRGLAPTAAGSPMLAVRLAKVSVSARFHPKDHRDHTH